jgi:DNA-binding HxlR family transcriptional regulator
VVFITNGSLVLTNTQHLMPILGTGEKAIGLDSLWKAIRKLSSENSMAVVKALCDGGKTFRELQAETGLLVNDLNHTLYDMKQIGLVTQLGEKKGERTYNLTSYCVLLLDSIKGLQGAFQHLNGKNIFSAHI